MRRCDRVLVPSARAARLIQTKPQPQPQPQPQQQSPLWKREHRHTSALSKTKPLPVTTHSNSRHTACQLPSSLLPAFCTMTDLPPEFFAQRGIAVPQPSTVDLHDYHRIIAGASNPLHHGNIHHTVASSPFPSKRPKRAKSQHKQLPSATSATNATAVSGESASKRNQFSVTTTKKIPWPTLPPSPAQPSSPASKTCSPSHASPATSRPHSPTGLQAGIFRASSSHRWYFTQPAGPKQQQQRACLHSAATTPADSACSKPSATPTASTKTATNATATTAHGKNLFLDRSRPAFALDCEMVATRRASAMVRISIVDEQCNVVLDEYVRPQQVVTDFRTKYSGLTPRNLHRGKTWESLKPRVADLLQGAIVIGHDVRHDFEVMHMHPLTLQAAVWDTSDVASLRAAAGLPIGRKPKLAALSQALLGETIQDSHMGHSSVEDAMVRLLSFRSLLVSFLYLRFTFAMPPF